MNVAAGCGVDHSDIDSGENALQSFPSVAEWAIPVAFLFLTVLGSPFLWTFQLDADEAINAIKSQLVGRRKSLNGEIWNDQPPLMTFFLAGLFRLTRENIVVGRGLVLALSCTLLWACARFARLAWGPATALVVPLLILLLRLFQLLSVSLMIGLPALALGAAPQGP